MSCNKKRRAVEPLTEEIPTSHVYVVWSLEIDRLQPSQKTMRGIYAHLSSANCAAFNLYNTLFAEERKVGAEVLPTPESRRFGDGGYEALAWWVEGEYSPYVRLRGDGGLRFGTGFEEGYVRVVWVERREVDVSDLSGGKGSVGRTPRDSMMEGEGGLL